jgi:glyoxylase-like metal-dependent hydrolase (beta-lactamase superfamily II)
MALLYAGRYLFTGDHLAWDRTARRLTAFRDYCWHSWDEQQISLARLLNYDFEWILPGHGQRARLAPKIMRRELAAVIERIGGKTQPAEKH